MQNVLSERNNACTQAKKVSDYFVYESSKTPLPFGLVNDGANCWGNALMQLLLSIPSLCTYIHSNPNLFEHNMSARILADTHSRVLLMPHLHPPMEAGRQFVETLKDAAVESHQGKPGSYNHALARLRGGGQQCAEEALTLFLETLSNQRAEKIFKIRQSLTIRCTSCRADTSVASDHSYRFFIPRTAIVDSEQLFRGYLLAHNSICSHYRCDQCHAVQGNCNRIERLRCLGEVFIVVFDKISGPGPTYYPERLSFPSVAGAPPLQYQLVAAIEHYGSSGLRDTPESDNPARAPMNFHTSGHYAARVLRQGEWYMINDSSVSRTSFQVSSDTFMLAYHMCGN